MPKAYRSFNVIYEGESYKFAPGDDVPDEIADTVEPVIFQAPEEEERFTDGNANTELIGETPHAEKVRQGEEDEGGANDNYNRMKVQELIQLATDRDLELPDNPKKAQLISLLRESDAAE